MKIALSQITRSAGLALQADRAPILWCWKPLMAPNEVLANITIERINHEALEVRTSHASCS